MTLALVYSAPDTPAQPTVCQAVPEVSGQGSFGGQVCVVWRCPCGRSGGFTVGAAWSLAWLVAESEGVFRLDADCGLPLPG